MLFWKSHERSTFNSYTAIYIPSRRSSKKDFKDMLDTVSEVKRCSWTTFSDRHLYIRIPILAGQQRLNFNISVGRLGTVWRTYRVRWLIGTDCKMDLEESVLLAPLDDGGDDDDIKRSLITWIYLPAYLSRCKLVLYSLLYESLYLSIYLSI